jgi:5-methylcytosine-specific restriction protein A
MSSADFDPQIPLGAVLTNKEVAAAFKCSNNGGMRRSHTTNTLVITTSPYSLYLDRWDAGILNYCGMGQVGDQRLDGTQNRTLAESADNGVGVHLFEVLADNEYTYRGRVVLAGEPYRERQFDREGDERLVWMFPLRLADGSDLPPLSEPVLKKAEAARSRAVRRLSDEEVARRAQLAAAQPSQRTVTSTAFGRDPNVVEAAKRRARGICQLCGNPAPFTTRAGEPFLETHHIDWLAEGGEDTIANTVALCPNCHRRVHQLREASDLAILRRRARSGL